jgi:probable F420-dependent oxidoreductase
MSTTGRELAERLGPYGVWCSQLQWQRVGAARDAVAHIEELGFGALWIGEATGKEVMTHATLLLGGSNRIVVATGIASVWGRDPVAMANAGRTLEDAYPGRFVLGLGVSHPFLTTPREQTYQRPLERMRSYLLAMDGAPYAGPDVEQPPRILGALGPKMLELARDRTAGAHPYFVPVEHTEFARTILGPEPLLAPEQAVLISRNGDDAAARRYVGTYVRLANYARNLARLGFGADDVGGDGSERAVEAMVARGGSDAAVERITEHLEAGADHVAVRVLTDDPKRLPFPELDELAATLGIA